MVQETDFENVKISKFQCAVTLTLTLECHASLIDLLSQCELKKSPLKFSDIFSQTVGNFSTKFYVPIIRSYPRWTTNFNSIIYNFDEVTPY